MNDNWGKNRQKNMAVLRVTFALLGATAYIFHGDPSGSGVGAIAGTSPQNAVGDIQKLTHSTEKTYFPDVSPKNVTAIAGQSVVLRCQVKHPGERTVSWMRKRDLHILTSSIFTYTTDQRFAVIHPEASDDWDLEIEYVQQRDAGIYECQVNTEPKIHLAIMLNVQDAQAKIWGPEEVYVKKGSTISLTCTVNVQAAPPSSVLWYHAGVVIDFDGPRGGVSLVTEKSEAGTTSKLLVTKAELSDSGNYSCVPKNAASASVVVHVLNGEHPAAMQHGGGCGITPKLLLALLTPFVGNMLR
ncbi:zwei Ig domain protein zig-8-like [Diprion similis]|uniref:zwei Ig domain protein zig-8-like n=1 Tax=Diprion similis TaxID=362088 RepID=UPI001EF80653|nr:zwei Ig domain protein zig-8-like [Diprion similis]